MEPKEFETGELDLSDLEVVAGRSTAVPIESVVVSFGAESHPGLQRANNEDHYLVARLSRIADVLTTNLPDGYVPRHFEQDAYAFAVADGMGGAAAGEVASALALSLGTSLTLDASRWHLQLDEKAASRLAERVTEFFGIIDRALAERARQEPALAGMGTTLTVAYTVGLDGLVFHVGDSRAYLWRRGVLTQITRDDTLVQRMADAGDIPPDAMATHPMRHVLTRAMGSGTGAAEAVASPVRFEPGDCLLLCTDGLSDRVDHDDMAAILGQGADPAVHARTLIDRALAAGGHDNITVVVAHFAT